MEVDLLYVDGCPNRQLAADRLRIAAERVGLPISIRSREISSVGVLAPDFRGSPTLLFGGSDLFPFGQAADTQACRLYATEHGIEGAPSVSALEEVLSKLAKQP